MTSIQRNIVKELEKLIGSFTDEQLDKMEFLIWAELNARADESDKHDLDLKDTEL